MERIEIICTVIGAVAVLLSGIWFIINQIIKLSNKLVGIDYRFDAVNYRLDGIEKTLSSLPCASHSDDLTNIKSIIAQKFPSLSKSASLKLSPSRLSPWGLQLFNDIGGDEFLNANKEALFKYISDHKPLTKLDVEQEANASFFSLLNTPAFNKLKDYIYEAPPVTLENGEPYTLAVPDICFILSLPLRDMYLKENPI
ncbi:hypothetical protein AGMMS49965_13160 [Bacteroidia bacterium]|nr:hypothetical protein AGMMS49965_13160 [Bacteroidia bacterium]